MKESSERSVDIDIEFMPRMAPTVLNIVRFMYTVCSDLLVLPSSFVIVIDSFNVLY